jgi:CRISPR system Cascade subunit CasA
MSESLTSFDLTQKPWIPVVTQEGLYQELSLRQLFEQWSELRELQAENPPTTLALHRFLVALLHYVYEGPKDEEDWERIKENNAEEVITYLKEQQGCFDLLHPERPFMQDPNLTADLAGEIYQAYALHGNNTSTVFCHEHQWSGDSLSIAAAARLVLRLQVFDVGGRKAGSSVPAGVIPSMDAANVLVRGSTLKDTLLLNLMQYDAEEKPFPVNGKDLPAWEQDFHPAKERVPSGYVNYLTFQWRRVRLFVQKDGAALQNNRAVRVAVHAGDRLPKLHSPADYEMAIAYIKNPKKPEERFPVRLNLNRSLWRDSAAFLQSSDAWNCPRIIGWLAELQAAKLVTDVLNLTVLGLTVDNAKPLGWAYEQFSAPISYIQKDGKPMWQALNAALQFAEQHQKLFRSFRGSPYAVLAEELKHPDAGSFSKSLDGESRYWAALDREFHDLLHQKLPADKIVNDNGTSYGNQALREWEKTVQAAAKRAFTDSIAAIRNYQARSAALRTLEWKLTDLRASPEEKETRKAKAAAKKKKKVSK